MPNEPIDFVLEQINLERLRFSIHEVISKKALSNVDKVIIEEQAKCIVARIERDIWGYREEIIVDKYPADWWQHFKYRWCPKFILKRCPIKYKEVKVSGACLFPNLAPMERDQDVKFTIFKNYERQR